MSQYGWVNPEVGQSVKVVTEKANSHKNVCPSLFEHITIRLCILCQPVQGACPQTLVSLVLVTAPPAEVGWK